MKIAFEKFLVDIYDDSAFARMKSLLLESNPEFYEKDTSNKPHYESSMSHDDPILGKRSSSKNVVEFSGNSFPQDLEPALTKKVHGSSL